MLDRLVIACAVLVLAGCSYRTVKKEYHYDSRGQRQLYAEHVLTSRYCRSTYREIDGRRIIEINQQTTDPGMLARAWGNLKDLLITSRDLAADVVNVELTNKKEASQETVIKAP